MDEDTSSAPDTSVNTESEAPTAPVTEGTTPEPDQQTGVANDSDSTETPAASNDNEPQTDPAKTPDETVPDKGIEPDKGVDPDAPDTPEQTPNQDDKTDLSKMTRAERREFYQNIERENQRRISQAIDQTYQPQDRQALKEAYMEQGLDEFQADWYADRDIRDQQNQITQAKNEIIELNGALAVEAMEVVNTYPWLNSQNEGKGYDPDTTNAVTSLYEAMVTKDPNSNQIIEAKLTPRQFYGLMDMVRQSGAQEARLQGQRNAERELASVAPQSSTTRTREPNFADLSPEQMRERLQAKGHVF